MIDDLNTQIRIASDNLAPTDDARARIVESVHERTRTNSSDRRPRGRRRGLTGWAFAVTVAVGAAAIVTVIAYAPGDPSPGHHRFVGPLTAATALANAGDAAGSADDEPLGAHELFHVYFTSFQPDNSAFKNDPGYEDDSGSFGTVQGFESWLDRDGRGAVLNVRGGGPNVTAQVSRDPKTGKITTLGFGARPLKPGEKVSVKESLEHPVNVSVMSWPQDGSPPTSSSWVRAHGDKLELAARNDLSETAGSIPMDAAGNQKQFWSVPISEVDKLTGHGEVLDRQIDTLLKAFLADSPYRSNRIPTGTYGITAASKDREESIEEVVRVLGMAPFGPRVRQALFRWLARQPDVELDGPTKDALGRVGTGVRFETVYDRQVPASTVSASQLVAHARAAGMTDIRPVKSTAKFIVKAHREFRRWTVRLIFDEATGQILQAQTYSSQRSPGATVPMLMVDQHGDTKVLAQGDQMNEAGAVVYIERGRVDTIKPASPACKVQPDACKP